MDHFQPEPQCPTAAEVRSWKRWALLLVLVGVLWRLVRYLMGFPVWGDESFICLNLVDQDYLGLTHQLKFGQVAPLLFLWCELAMYHLAGASELALRLIPLLAGLASLALFWRLAWRVLPPRGAALAAGILAVSIYPVRHSTEVKPYAFDLLMALLLLLPAVEYLHRPERLRWLVILALLVPLALGASYPAVFVAGAVSLALLPAAWRRPAWGAKGLFAAYNLLMVATFLACFWFVGREQLDPVAGTTEKGMQDYWGYAFPPTQPLNLLWWLIEMNTGRLFAYPWGDGNFASTPPFVLAVVGAGLLWRRRQRTLLVLCVVPFVLNFLAAAMHRYPYGGCARLSQHLAPAVCLLAGAGTAVVIERLGRTVVARQRLMTVVCVWLLAFGVGSLGGNVVHPYRSISDVWTRQKVDEVFAHAGPDDLIVIREGPDDTKVTIRWLLIQRGERVNWGGHVEPQRLAMARQVWLIHHGYAPLEPGEEPALLKAEGRHWQLADHSGEVHTPADKESPLEYWNLQRWVCTP